MVPEIAVMAENVSKPVFFSGLLKCVRAASGAMPGLCCAADDSRRGELARSLTAPSTVPAPAWLFIVLAIFPAD